MGFAEAEATSPPWSGLGAASAATVRGSLALSPRSPKHTMQVTDIGGEKRARMVCREAERMHEEQLERKRDRRNRKKTSRRRGRLWRVTTGGPFEGGQSVCSNSKETGRQRDLLMEASCSRMTVQAEAVPMRESCALEISSGCASSVSHIIV